MTARWLVAGYSWPGDTDKWSAINGNVQRGDIVIINPASGPGDTRSELWANVRRDLTSVGAAVIGYVPIGRLDPNILGADGRPSTVGGCLMWLARYRAWYGVDGGFFDEAPSVDRGGLLADLRRLHGAARATPIPTSRPHGYRRGVSVFNPGAGPQVDSWVRALPGSIWCTTETDATSYLASPASTVAPSTRPRLATLIHTATPATLDAVRTRIAADGVGFAAVTFDTLPNPYDSPPLRP